MGEGKTEAAIYLATQWMSATGGAGMYVALPTAATSNQMHGRVQEFIQGHSGKFARRVRLVHGMAWLADDVTPGEPARAAPHGDDLDFSIEWFRPARRALLAPFAVGTVDQALMAVLHVKFGFLRLCGLAGKVLIIDEVHAYDAYMSRILTLLLRWCSVLDIPVVLLSATLPARRRMALLAAYSGGKAAVAGVDSDVQAGYPLISYADRDGNRRRIDDFTATSDKAVLITQHWGLLGDEIATAVLARQLVAGGGCVCVIANTVHAAQATFRHLRDICESEIELLLFHSRFTAERRIRIEQEVLDRFDKRSLLPAGEPRATIRPRRCILVATQVVEQSLDLDFDEMISEVAPIDLLLQRAGRLHRHDRDHRPTGHQPRLHVLMPHTAEQLDFGGTERVYDRFILLKTICALDGLETLRIPQDLRGIIEAVYDGRPEAPRNSEVRAEDLVESQLKAQRAAEAEEAAAGQYLIPEPYPRAFKLARVGHQPFGEDEGGGASYFHAKTRYGDETRRVIVLHGDEFRDELQQSRCPTRSIVRRIMLRMASVPRWWVIGASPTKGFEPLAPGPSWLRGVLVVRMEDGMWCGRDHSGRDLTITEDAELGLLHEFT